MLFGKNIDLIYSIHWYFWRKTGKLKEIFEISHDLPLTVIELNLRYFLILYYNFESLTGAGSERSHMERTRATFIALQNPNNLYCNFSKEIKHNVITQAQCVTSLCLSLGFRTKHKLLKQIPLPFSGRKAGVTCLTF